MNETPSCPRRHTEAKCIGVLKRSGDHYTCDRCRQMFPIAEVERFCAIGVSR